MDTVACFSQRPDYLSGPGLPGSGPWACQGQGRGPPRSHIPCAHRQVQVKAVDGRLDGSQVEC